MLNLTAMFSGRRHHYEVILHRKASLSAYQNARKRLEHVTAATAEEAKRLAEQKPGNGPFKAVSVRVVS